MHVTGYMIREALKRQELRKNVLEVQVKSALWRFKEEDKLTADEAMAQAKEAEEKIADLEVIQDRYNLQVMVDVQGVKMPLARAVKLVGGAGRIEKQWRDFSTDTGKRGYRDDQEITRDKDVERAERTLSARECLDRSTKAAGYAGSLRAAIAEGNSQRVNFDDLDASLFE